MNSSPSKRPALGALLLALALAVPAQAATDSGGDVVISADKAVFRQQDGFGLYQGNAELRQGNRQVTADRIELHLRNDVLHHVIAQGSPVTLREGDELEARGDKLEYDVADQRIVLSGNARIRQNGRSFEGGRVVYDLRSRNVEASGTTPEDRVRIVIPAADTQQGNNNEGARR